MEQTFKPNIGVGSIRGWCLKYVDDAGSAPFRTATAKIAYTNEVKVGRIRTDIIPENIWLVGFLAFTTGQFVDYGHVFFIKRSGSTYEIHDSEVHAGARNPYRSINELISWFGAYNARYIGWSTHCDGREYARVKQLPPREEKEMVTRNGLAVLYKFYLGSDVSEYGLKNRLGKQTFDEAQADILNSPEYAARIAKIKESQVGLVSHLPARISEVVKLPEQE